jgi:hypothetical protein
VDQYGEAWWLLLTVASLVFGASFWTGMGVVFFVTVWTLVGAWRLGERLGGSGVWTVGLLAALPVFGHFSHHVQFDMLLMGYVVWFLAILAEDDALGKRRTLFWLTLLLVAGIMTKPSTPAFMLPPAALIWCWRRESRSLWAPVLFGSALLASAAWLWQAADWQDVVGLANTVTTKTMNFPAMEGPRWAYYLSVAIVYQLGVAGVVLAALGFWRQRRSPLAWMVLFAALGGIVAHSGLPYRKHYYTTPILPPLAALGSIWLLRARRPVRWTAGALMTIALLHGHWGVPGVADGLPSSFKWLTLNYPRVFTPEPQKVPTKVGRAAAIGLALAEQESRFELLMLPRGPKLITLVDRPDLLSFDRALLYEITRRGARMHTTMPHHGVPTAQARVLFFEGREPNVDTLMAGCLSLNGAQRDLHERQSKEPCPFSRDDMEQLIGRVTIVQRTEVRPGNWRALGVLSIDGDSPWGPFCALRALRYAEALGVELDPMVSKEAASATPEMLATDAATPLRFFRGLAYQVEAEGHG